MKKEPTGQFAKPANRKGDTSTSEQRPLRIGRSLAALAVSLFCCGVATADDGDSPIQLRRFIDGQVAGIEKLMVPAEDANLPQARLPDGTDASADPRFRTTEAKRYLGKQLFHDPIRTARILLSYFTLCRFGCTHRHRPIRRMRRPTQSIPPPLPTRTRKFSLRSAITAKRWLTSNIYPTVSAHG